MNDIIIKNAQILDGECANIVVKNGRIDSIGNTELPKGIPVEDAQGKIALPAFTEAHTHLDKSLIGYPWYFNDVGGGNLVAMIENERAIKKRYKIDPYLQSMRHALQTVAYGAAIIRSHVDIDTDGKLSALEGVLRTKDELKDIVDIQTVAFPQSGLTTREGTSELMDEALSLGADIVGGLDPCSIDKDPKGHLDVVFNLAQKHQKPIDIHLHEAGELGAFSLTEIIARTKALGMEGKVAVSHAFCLGMPDKLHAFELMDQLAKLDIRIMTTAPMSSPAPMVKELLARGVKVGSGNDGIQDTWGPYGNGDMLERAKFVGLRNNLRANDEILTALDICSGGGAQAIGFARRELAVGAPGDLVIVEGLSVAHAIANHPDRHLVVKAGKIVAKSGQTLMTSP